MIELPIPVEYEGSLCEIKTVRNTLIATGRIHKITRSGVQIRDKNNEMSILRFGESVKINVFNTKLGCKVYVGAVYTSTKDQLYLTDVVSLMEHERRNFFRVDMNQVLKAQYIQNSYEPSSGVTEIVLKDMSLNGIRFLCHVHLGRMTLVNIDVDIGKRKPIGLQYRIVRILGENKGLVTYGCELVSDINASKSDALCSFLFKKQREFLNGN